MEDNNNTVDKLVRLFGSQKAVAEIAQCSPNSVSNWRKRGVPLKSAKAISDNAHLKNVDITMQQIVDWIDIDKNIENGAIKSSDFQNSKGEANYGRLMKTLSSIKSHGGVQGVYTHQSDATHTPMTFSVFVPPHEAGQTLPVLWYLSGLTCTHANVMEKGEYRQACAEHGVIFVAPDTSPRGDGVADDPDGAYDFGLGAGFYVNATRAPYSNHYKMRDYIEKELPRLIAENFPADMSRQGITGHSMGGHGALTIGLRNLDVYKSISAFSPIVSPVACPWGQKALTGYLGGDQKTWEDYDACALIKNGAHADHLLIDQGLADDFLESQLKPDLIEAACRDHDIKLNLRRHAGYDHSYYFISTFLADHIAWHKEQLK